MKIMKQFFTFILLLAVFIQRTPASVRFDAVTDRARRTASTPSYGAADTYTIMCWFKIINDRGNYSSVFAFGTASPLQIVVQTGANGHDLVLWDTGAEIPGPTLTVGTWYHIAYTHDASGNVVVYVNGVSQITQTAVQSPSGTVMQFGNDDIYDEWADAEIDYPRVWQATLTGGEVAAEYASATPVKASPWAYYDFANATGAATDQSGNSRDLTLSGLSNGASRPSFGGGGGGNPNTGRASLLGVGK